MSANEDLGTFVRCHWRNVGGGYTDFPGERWKQFQRYISSSFQEFVQETSVIGGVVLFRPSDIAVLQLSTPALRRLSYERDELWKRETEEMEKPSSPFTLGPSPENAG